MQKVIVSSPHPIIYINIFYFLALPVPSDTVWRCERGAQQPAAWTPTIGGQY